MEKNKKLVICADDYAINSKVSEGIRELLLLGKINAVSVLSASKLWVQEAQALRDVDGFFSVGLHLCLTELSPLTSSLREAWGNKIPSISQLIAKSYLGQLPLDLIRQEFKEQISKFVEHFGCLPSHIDGHQHCHILPGIRDIIIELVQELWRDVDQQVWVRSCYQTAGSILQRRESIFKSYVLSRLSKKLLKKLRRMEIHHNQDFSGAYSMGYSKKSYHKMFNNFIQSSEIFHLIMCHPGHACHSDRLGELRKREFIFFKHHMNINL